MTKKILAFIISVIMLIPCITACKPADNNAVSSGMTNADSSAISTGTDADADINTDTNTDKDTDKNKVETSSKKENTSSKTSQVTTSSIPSTVSKDEGKTPSKEDKDTSSKNQTSSKTPSTNPPEIPDDTSSKTESSGVKYYKNSVQLGTYHLAMRWCDYYGTDFASREKQFREVVEERYFNTYFLHAQDTDYLLKEIEIIVENGGTFWLTLWNHHTSKETIERHEQELQKVIDMIDSAGYLDALQGMFMDEPIWNGQSNADFLAQTKLYYQKFGLRTFPVFALGEFNGSDVSLSTPGVRQGRISTAAMKYVTDVGFDSYGVDVRDSATNGAQSYQYGSWSSIIGSPVTNGKDYYIGYKNLLKKRIGHKVNYWYFPTAFEWNIYNGGRADEHFCMGHLEFMANDILSEEYSGGIALYTYYKHKTHNTTALAQHLDVKDDNGNYIHFTEYTKWKYYSNLLRLTREKFDSTKANLVNLGV